MDAQLYGSKSNVPHEKRVAFKFFVDAGNAPILAGYASAGVNSAGNPLNLYVASVLRVSQGLFRLTLTHAFKHHVRTDAELNVNAAGVQRWAQPGPVANPGTATPVTVDILIVDNAGAVQDPPAANANNFVSGEILFCDTGAV